MENNIEEYAYYCPYCGEPPKEGQALNHTVCNKCKKSISMVRSRYEKEYYVKQALMKYGDAHYWEEFLLLEMQESTVFDPSLYYKKQPKDNNDKRDKVNKAKCPNCGSTNIKSVSETKSKGLFGKKTITQSECRSCYFKW